MNIFVSHAWEDKNVITELLKFPEFIKLWIDHKELAAGELLSGTIRSQIDDSHLFAVILSQESVNSEWVRKELEWAVKVAEMRNRPFILPIVISQSAFDEASDDFKSLIEDRLQIIAVDRSPEGTKKSTEEIEKTLFHWLNDWLEQSEPTGNGNTLFIERLDSRIKQFQKHLYALKAALNWPLTTLIKDDALAFLDQSKNEYNDFTQLFLAELAEWEDEVKWRFEKYPYKQYVLLVAYIRDKIYHGAAYALNQTISAINSYEQISQQGSEAVTKADEQRQSLIASFDTEVESLIEKTADYLKLLKTQ